MQRIVRLLCGVVVLATASAAGEGDVRFRGDSPASRRAEPTRDFDYLLGDWEFTGTHGKWGALRGYWSAVRLAEGQVLDEYRVVGDDGMTVHVTTTVRAYNAVAGCWDLVSVDTGGGLRDTGTARRVGDEMHVEQRFGVMSPQPSLWRIRYHGIRPDRFSWTGDRSTDDGRTWTTGYLVFEARRVGAPRELGPLAGPGRKTGSARR